MAQPLLIRKHSFIWGERTYLMGVLNVTPDSFSDGGEFNNLDCAITQAQQLIAAGADIIDIGGQSTRPGAVMIAVEQELNRTIPVIQRLRQVSNIPISIDTTRVEVARRAIEAGADIVNDVSGGTFEASILSVVAQLGVPIILMHLRGTPATMQSLTDYGNLLEEVYTFLETQINLAVSAGIEPDKIIIDPGIGFAKTYSQSLELIQKLSRFRDLGRPILVGPSRKSFIGKILNQSDPKQRVWGTAAACCGAIAGGADILRIHDVAPMRDVCLVADAIWRSQNFD